ncbi:hypothetical protein [Nostoc sp.]
MPNTSTPPLPRLLYETLRERSAQVGYAQDKLSTSAPFPMPLTFLSN